MTMTFLDALIYSVLGLLVVFFALFLLMCIIMLMTAFDKKESAVVPEPVSAPQPVPVPAPGSAGELKLYNTDPRTAAMLMAIVADELQVPVNELRFISIKEVEE